MRTGPMIWHTEYASSLLYILGGWQKFSRWPTWIFATMNWPLVGWIHCHFGSDVIASWSSPTHINTPSPSSAPASCLSCCSQLTEYRGLRRQRGGGGWVDSWADAEAPPGFAGDGLFPSHPAAVQLPRHQLSWWPHQTDQGLPHCGGWLRMEWRWCGVV